MKRFQIAVFPGDGIGVDVTTEAVRVLDRVQELDPSFAFDYTHLPWGVEYWKQHGKVVPDDFLSVLRPMDAILLGAVGWPAVVPDHITLAPLVTGNPGPAGQLTELLIAQVLVEIVEPGPQTVWLSGAFDARLGMNAALSPGGLGVVLDEPAAADTAMVILGNPLGADAEQLETVLELAPPVFSFIFGVPRPEVLERCRRAGTASRSSWSPRIA